MKTGKTCGRCWRPLDKHKAVEVKRRGVLARLLGREDEQHVAVPTCGLRLVGERVGRYLETGKLDALERFVPKVPEPRPNRAMRRRGPGAPGAGVVQVVQRTRENRVAWRHPDVLRLGA